MPVFKIPSFIHSIYPGFEWKYETNEKELYLTFDDGPCSGVTNWILDKLDEYHARATFFCVGENVHKEPGLYNEITQRGHAIGNHTYHHLNNRKSSDEEYVDNVIRCSELVETSLFRPPYGRINPRQATTLINKGYRIIMYSVLANDFNPKLSPEFIFRKINLQTTKGSIVVFHDSIKAKENMKSCLPMFLDSFAKQGYRFLPIL